MALPQFIFGGNTGIKNPEELARARMLAEALLGPQRPAQNVGEGLAVLGQAIRGRREMSAANRASEAGTASAGSAIAKALGGAGAFPAAPSLAPSGGGSQVSAASVPQTASAKAIRDGLIKRGLPEHVADGFLLNFKDESNLNPGINEQNPTVPGSRGGFGLAQWTGPRRRALEAFAAQQGKPASDLDTQLDFTMQELGGPEAAAYQAIQAAPDAGSAAAAIVNKFLRPRDDLRAKREASYLKSGAPVQVASNDPSIGMPSPQTIGAALQRSGQQAPNAIAQALSRAQAAGGQAATPAEFGQQDIERLRNTPRPADAVPYNGPGATFTSGDVAKMEADRKAREQAQLDANTPPEILAMIKHAQAGQQPGVTPGAPGAVTPAGQRVMGRMMGQQPIGGQFQGIEPSLRPFNPGERRPNPDGSYSTEISTTQQQPDGQFVNTPSLWMGRQGPVQFNPNDERGIMSEAGRFEAQNGPTFARFPDVQPAEQAAAARSAAGGAGAGRPSGKPQGPGTPGEIRKGADGKNYQYAQTTGMQGATGDSGWIETSMEPTGGQQVAQGQPNLDQIPVEAGGNAGAIKQGQLPSMQQLLEASQNPWLNEQQRGIVNMLIKQQMDQADPNNQLDSEYKRAQIDALRAKEPTKPAGIQEYEYAKQQGFPGTFQDWEASKKGGMSLQVDPETGAITFQQGGNIKPMTEGQSKDTTFATRAAGALPLIDQFGDALTSLPETMGGQVPVIGNFAKSKEFQQAEQAGKEFLQAILRKDTGAAITAGETAEYGSVYLPRPGDSPELLAQKKASRARALEALKAGMTPQALLAQEKALAAGGQAQPAPEAPKKRLKFNPATGELE